MNAYASAATNSIEEQNDLITENIDLVKRIAYHLKARLPENTDVDDLMQSGLMGLVEAAKNYDASRGASFSTFAGIRIRGAMIDEVRRYDWTPRSVLRKRREIAEAMHSIEAETGRHAEAGEIARRLNISTDEYHKILRDSANCKMFSLDEAMDESVPTRQVANEAASLPDDEVAADQFRQVLADAIDRLPEKEQLVLSIYYERELNLKEIGAVLGVSESRVCQIHSQAVARLRSMVSR